jgi:hypothetical protein
MQSPIYTSQAIHLTPHACVDVHADAETVVLGYVGDVVTTDAHLTPEQAMELADALTEGAAKCLAARSAS